MNNLLTTVNATRDIPYLQILFPEWIDNMRCIFWRQIIQHKLHLKYTLCLNYEKCFNYMARGFDSGFAKETCIFWA